MSIETTAAGIEAKLKSGKTLATGLVILSIGVRPESGLAKDAGLELGPRGHIQVDAWQLTSDPDIYAVGDVCETSDPILGKRAAIPLGGPANRQGRTAADHLFLGAKALPYPGSIGTAIVRVFDHAAGIAKGVVKRHSGVAGKTEHVLDAGSGKNIDERSRPLHRQLSLPLTLLSRFVIRTAR